MTIRRMGAVILLASALLGCNLLSTPDGPPPPPAEPPRPQTAPAVLPPTAVDVGILPAQPTGQIVVQPPEQNTPVPAAPAVIVQSTATPQPVAPATQLVTERVRFAAGSTSAVLSNRVLGAGASTAYQLDALTGQTMTVSLAPFTAADLANYTLNVTSLSGAAVPGSTSGPGFWSGVLPATQDYRITVTNRGAAPGTYTLTISIPFRIRFAPGAVSAALSGSLSPATTNTYVLEAAAGQTMTVAVNGAAGLWLSITGADGTPLLRGQLRQTSWTGILPANQDYFIGVGSESGGGDYQLQIWALTVERVAFQPGTTSATVPGDLNPGEVDTYAVEAAAGQTMYLSLSPPDGSVWLGLRGADGDGLLSTDARQTAWSGRLSADQDYFVTVQGASALHYTLLVSIPRRIRFAAGAVSATVEGQITGPYSVDYILEARAGQTMNVTVASPGNDVLLSITGADGIPLVRYVSGARSWSGALPASQDYIIQAVPTAETTSAGFSVTVSITG